MCYTVYKVELIAQDKGVLEYNRYLSSPFLLDMNDISCMVNCREPNDTIDETHFFGYPYISEINFRVEDFLYKAFGLEKKFRI